MTEKPVEILDPNGKNVTKHVEGVNQDESRKYFKPEYVKKKLNEMNKQRDIVMFSTLFYTGIRVSELNRIKKKNIDFQNNMMKIEWLKRNKIRKRKIPVKQNLINLLQIYTANMNQDDLLFDLSRQYITRLCKEYFGGSAHMMRHTFAVNYLRGGGTVLNLSRILGHKDIRTTMKYLQIVPKDVQEELENVEL